MMVADGIELLREDYLSKKHFFQDLERACSEKSLSFWCKDYRLIYELNYAIAYLSIIEKEGVDTVYGNMYLRIFKKFRDKLVKRALAGVLVWDSSSLVILSFIYYALTSILIDIEFVMYNSMTGVYLILGITTLITFIILKIVLRQQKIMHKAVGEYGARLVLVNEFKVSESVKYDFEIQHLNTRYSLVRKRFFKDKYIRWFYISTISNISKMNVLNDIRNLSHGINKVCGGK